MKGGGEGEGEANPNERCIFIIFGIPWHCKLTEELSSSWAGELSSTRALPIAARQMRSYRSLLGSRDCHLQGPLVSKVRFSKVLGVRASEGGRGKFQVRVEVHLQGPSTITSLPGSQASMINVHIERRVRSRPRHLWACARCGPAPCPFRHAPCHNDATPGGS